MKATSQSRVSQSGSTDSGIVLLLLLSRALVADSNKWQEAGREVARLGSLAAILAKSAGF